MKVIYSKNNKVKAHIRMFNFQIDRPEGGLSLDLNAGDVLFVVGANGSGKSTLVQRLYAQHSSQARRVSAHRQTWFEANASTLAPHQKRSAIEDMRSSDSAPAARWTDSYSSQRANIAISDIIDAENIAARDISSAFKKNDMPRATQLASVQSPVDAINEILKLSNLPITLHIESGEQITAVKAGSLPYSVAQLSDGERNALLISANVLTVKPGTLIVIDEPEKHLHRSITSPLLLHLISKRKDCAFVISTHDISLPAEMPNSDVLLVRGCQYENQNVKSWTADLLKSDVPIDNNIRKEILGARRRILFVEGEDTSLDKALYSLIFPNVTVLPKGGCLDVERAVTGIRSSHDLHWLTAFGLIDNDRRSPQDLQRMELKGIFNTKHYSIESLYYHPEIQKVVAQYKAPTTWNDNLELATQSALRKVGENRVRLCEGAAERIIREQIRNKTPGRTAVSKGEKIEISIDSQHLVLLERQKLDHLINSSDLVSVIERYPIRESGALDAIAHALGFANQGEYEQCVRQLLSANANALAALKSLFTPLLHELTVH